MNIPPPKQRQSFNLEILKKTDDELLDENSLGPSKLLFDVNDKWINQIRLQFNQNSQEGNDIDLLGQDSKEGNEEGNESQAQQIEDIKNKIQNLTNQNQELCNLDFNNMSLSEIESEIEKTKKNIIYDEPDVIEFQNRREEFQGKVDRGHKRVSDYKSRIIAFFNEIRNWSDPLIQQKFGEDEKTPEIDVFGPNISEEIKNYVTHLEDLKDNQ